MISDGKACGYCSGLGRDREGSRCQDCGGCGLEDMAGGLHPQAWSVRFDALTMAWRNASFVALTDMIERGADWMKEHGRKLDDLSEIQRGRVSAMIERQVRLGIDQGDFLDCGIPPGTPL